ncbi:hypothetical protein SAMN06298216_1988 [Spirosomataceae bacterium TFI 002]|nr:hypothetical protein SAMN06298216_1988 [Spirosomataceae bacterium TFI 002]
MELSHVISDGILTIVGFFVFFRFISRLELVETLLWESFILSVTVAAMFGTMRYAGVEKGDGLSLFFQHLAATVGAVGLLAAAWFGAFGRSASKTIAYVIIAIGFALFAINEAFNVPQVVQYTPLVCMPLVAVAGVVGLIKGNVKFGIFILLGVMFLTLAVFRDSLISSQNDAIDAYHYLLAVALICLGMAATSPQKA